MDTVTRVSGWIKPFTPPQRTARTDALAGLPGAISSVPDGMASSLLAGVSPIHGLYASAIGPIVGGAFTSTGLMTVTTTTAAALAGGSAVAGVPRADRTDALLLLTIIAGVFALAAGFAKLGRYTRFVSVSVMLGFLTGVAANIVFGQIPDLVGATGSGPFPLAQAVDVLRHPEGIDLSSVIVGATALALVYALARTRLRIVGSIVAIVVPSLLAVALDGVAEVSDAGPIPRGLPLPHLPDLGVLSVGLVTGAAAVAAIVLVQGAGVADAMPRTNGPPTNADRDFIAQGAANLASGFFRGQPVGGSVGSSALNVSAGGRTRWAAIFSGLWMLVILFAFAGAVGHVALPTLAAVLVTAAIASVQRDQITTVVRTGASSQIAFATTLLATLLLPIAAAVGIGVALSLLLQLNREALDLAVVELVPIAGGGFVERPAPRTLQEDHTTLLDVYGSLFYAGAKTLAARLPDPAGARAPSVVLRLRGRTTLGATSFIVLADYARRLDAAGGRLYLSGVDENLVERFDDGDAPLTVVPGTPLLGESSHAALELAEARRALRSDEPVAPGDGNRGES